MCEKFPASLFFESYICIGRLSIAKIEGYLLLVGIIGNIATAIALVSLEYKRI